VLVSGYAASASAAPEQFPVLRKPFRIEQLARRSPGCRADVGLFRTARILRA